MERPDPARADELLGRLTLSPLEREGLRRVWPNDYWVRLRDILLHHEDVALECDTRLDTYDSRASEVWVSQLRAEASRIVDIEDPALEVHIISSNTHSVGNCLSPYLARRAEEILAWGRERYPELGGEASTERPWGSRWRNPRDLLYVVARRYLREVAGAAAEKDAEEAAAGAHHLDTTAFTGIEVDLFDVRRLEAGLTDPDVLAPRATDPILIINIDYAFGEQAEEILANLLFLFGRRVRSVSVIGKAGGLVGGRGEILLPAATLLQTNDELYPAPNQDLPADLMRRLAPGIPVHEGPVLTWPGPCSRTPRSCTSTGASGSAWAWRWRAPSSPGG